MFTIFPCYLVLLLFGPFFESLEDAAVALDDDVFFQVGLLDLRGGDGQTEAQLQHATAFAACHARQAVHAK